MGRFARTAILAKISKIAPEDLAEVEYQRI
jgi:hypothetical protein